MAIASGVELCWENKARALVALPDGGYAWGEASDAGDETRAPMVLHERTRVGDVRTADQHGLDNLLICGDSGQALQALAGDPALANMYTGQVKLVYVDPPFNTGKSFMQYDDAIAHSMWLSMMRERLVRVRDLLCEDGSVWVHVDDAEMAYTRVLMDEVFGRGNFLATIVWQKRRSREGRSAFSSSQDYIVVYGMKPGSSWKTVRNLLPGDVSAYTNPDKDPRGAWKSVPMSAQGYRPNQMYPITTPTGRVHLPPAGGCWRHSEPVFLDLVADGRIYWPKNGDGKPRKKRYLTEEKGLVPHTLWLADEVGDNAEGKREIQSLFPGVEPFATPKPERLLERVIHIATDPGDIVLDCFAGSGTTAAVAHKMGRRWVTVERSPTTVADFTQPRLSAIVQGTDLGGITNRSGWLGGSGYRVLDVRHP